MPATLEIDVGISGLTLTCDLFPDQSDTAAVSGATLTEASNRKGLYTASITGLTGLHKIKLYASAAFFPFVGYAVMATAGTVTANNGRAVNTLGGVIATEANVDDTKAFASSASGSASSLVAIFAGMTSLPNWIRRFLRGDAGTAGMIAAQAEINTGGTATFDGTTDNLEDIKDAAGGGSITVQPLQSTINERVSESTIQAYYNEAGWSIGPVVVVDANDDPVDLTAYATLRFIIEDQYGTDLLSTTSVTVSGADDNQWTATGTAAVTATAPARHRWALRGENTGVDVVLGRGPVVVTKVADS